MLYGMVLAVVGALTVSEGFTRPDESLAIAGAIVIGIGITVFLVGLATHEKH